MPLFHVRAARACGFAALMATVCAQAHGQSGAATSYNTFLATQTFSPAYQFTAQSELLETAQGIRATGSNVIKLNLAAGKYDGLVNEPTRLDELANWGDFKQVLDMDFAHYLFWAYSENPLAWRYGDYTQTEANADYQEVYDLTTHLLTEYSGTNKTFYIGHWEGDWHLLNGEDRLTSPDPQFVNQMAAWLNVRQLAIDNAKAALAGTVNDVDVFQYTEVNHVRKAIENPELNSVTNSVLPLTNVDYVSWSAWEMLNAPATPDLADAVSAGLEHIQSQLAPKAGLPTDKRAFLGELGWNIANQHVAGSEANREARARAAALGAIEWGAPFILYWQFYDNSANNGEDKRFWLIDGQGNETPLYWTMYNYNLLSEQYIQQYVVDFGELPSEDIFRQFALTALATVSSAGPLPDPTPAGDVNGDGVVNLLDFDILAQRFGSQTLLGLGAADLNLDGAVNLLDFDILAQDFGVSNVAQVPEPASMAMLCVAVALTRRRRQRA